MQEKSVKAKIDLKGKTVLVTGAAGFIGSFLSERLLSDFEDIRVIGFDSVNDYYDIRLKASNTLKALYRGSKSFKSIEILFLSKRTSRTRTK